MTDNIFLRLFNILFRPNLAIKKYKDEKILSSPLCAALISLGIFSILIAVQNYIWKVSVDIPTDFLSSLWVFAKAAFWSVFVFFVLSGLFYGLMRAFKWRGPYCQVVKALSFVSVVFAAAWIFFFISSLTGIGELIIVFTIGLTYSLILLIYTLSKFTGLSDVKLALVFGVIVVLAIIVLLIWLFVVTGGEVLEVL